MSDARPSRAQRVGWVFAAVVLAGAAAGWSVVASTPDLPRWLAEVGGGLTPRETDVQSALQQLDRLAPAVPPLVMLSANPEDAAFARYLLYPRELVEAPVRPATRLQAALDALPDGARLLVVDDAVRAELERSARPAAGGPHFASEWAPGGAASLFRVHR